MSGICGWLQKDAAEVSSAERAAIGEALSRFDRSTVRATAVEGCGVVIAGRETDFAAGGATFCAVWGKPRIQDRDMESVARERGVAWSLMAAYRERGSRILESVRGHFALAILDDRLNSAFLAVDRMGTRPLYYSESGGRFAFATNLDALGALPGMDGKIRAQAIYDYVHFHVIPGPRTIYETRRRLCPGSFLTWSPAGAKVERYWEMRFVEDEERPFAELKEEFVSLLQKSVAERLNGHRTGAFLSGGTDSSTVAGMLGRVTGKPAPTYSIGFDAQSYDETYYARIAARHFGTDHHEYYVTPDDVVDAIPRIAALHDQPFGNASAIPAYYCAKLAREDGTGTLLGGDGGDELFGGNTRYATQHLYSLYSELPAPLRRAAIEPFVSLLPSIGLAGKAQRYIATASMPMPARYDNYNLLERLGPGNVFTPEFLATVDPGGPAKEAAASYADSRATSLINRMLAFDRKYTLADNDLPKVSRSCELAGVDVAYPLLDDALVDFSLRLPPRQKVRGTQLRYFFKKALADFLPEEIIRKSKHGFGLPFGKWFVEHRPLRDMACSSLSDLAKRGIIRPQIVGELTSAHVARHAEYFGTMVWILMMIEQWHRQRRIAV